MDRVEQVRRAQLRVLNAMLSELHSVKQGSRCEEAALALQDEPPAPLAVLPDIAVPPRREAPPTWLDDALARLRGTRLRLWRGT